MPRPSDSKSSAAGPSALTKGYLILYNLFNAAAWGFVLFKIAQHFIEGRPYDKLYPVIAQPLYIAQTAAVMEILHSLFGLVRSPVVTTAMQVASRLFLLWGIVDLIPESRSSWAFPLMATSWALVEVPRYLFYVFSLLNAVPFVLTYVRYSLFLVLYPSGITGELFTALAALPFIRDRRPWTYTMPNEWNVPFDYYWAVLIGLAFYLPGSPIMYGHMLAQRRKQLNPTADGAKTKSH